MELILRQDIDNLGKAGDVVTVKDGYARNFLIPKGLARVATPYNLESVVRERKAESTRQDRAKKEAQELAGRIETISCTITVEAQEDGSLFGSITAQDIVVAYEAEGVHLDKKAILLENPIKEVGIYRVPIKLHPDVIQEVKVWVVKS